ncbi:MAG: hypothetical protein P8X74_14645 [Reinekea sp.]
MVTRRSNHSQWLVGQPSALAQISALWIGSVGILVLGLQPILLGALINESRVNYDQLAIMATLEILTIGIGSVLAAFVVSANGLHLKTMLLLLGVAALDIWTAFASSPAMMIGIRTLIGLLEGGMVAIAVELIARSVHPGRYSGYYVSLQTTVQGLVAIILSQWVVPAGGSQAGFITLAAITLLTLGAVFSMPRSYGAIPSPDSSSASPLTLKAILSLLCVLFFYMFLGALWAFLEPIGLQTGITVTTIGLMVSASLGVQVVAALSATAVEQRLTYRYPLAGCALVAIIVSLYLASGPALVGFWLCTIAIGFVWLFVVPFQIRLTVACDPSRKTALLVPAAQLFGAAIGPVGATMFIRDDNFIPVALFAAGCAAMSLLVLSILASMRFQTATNPGVNG